MNSQKEQTVTLVDVRDHLAMMNGRLGKSEQWAITHDLYDANNFKEIKDVQREIKQDMKDHLKEHRDREDT